MDKNPIALAKIMAENEALLQSNRELKAHIKELSLFNYVASHDLQEPLRKMHTFVKMIADDKDNHISGDSAIYIERILVSASRMQRLIEDLLHYSHVDTLHENGYELSDINIIVQDALTDFNETIKNTRAKVTVTTLPNIKLIPPLVYQVIQNLVGNALKYRNKDEQPILRISYELASQEEIAPIDGKHEHADYYKIIIADNGIGFLQEQSDLIFEPFQRLHSKDKYEGTGIGLAICKKIMTRHKGYITAQSNPGKGTKFNLYFPV